MGRLKIALLFSSFLILGACGDLPGFTVLEKSDFETQKVSSVDFENVDILFVVDNSGSMAEEQANLADSFDAFISEFAKRSLNFQVGITSTDPLENAAWWGAGSHPWARCDRLPYELYANDGVGSLLTLDPNHRFITPDTPDYVQLFKDSVQLGICGSGAEAGILTSGVALSESMLGDGGWNAGFVRDNAFLAVIVLSDEDESRSAADTAYIKAYPAEREVRVDDFVEQMLALKPDRPELLRFDAIVGPSQDECPTIYNDASGSGVGDVYMEVAEQLNGSVANICEDFSDSLNNIGINILTMLTRFPLAQPPTDAGLEVRVNGKLTPENEENGWVYIADAQAIEFRGDAIPSDGASIEITYVPAKPLE